ECVKTFEAPACVIVKHANPCGVALGETPAQAYEKAFKTDSTSAFGGIIAFNRRVDRAAAEQVSKQFVEVLIAPGYTDEALALFKAKQNVRALELRVVTKRQPTPQQLQDLLFAWKVAKFVKSNAIVFCADGMTLGVGAGQMSRIDSARIASIKAANAGLSLAGSAVASDAFFPFRDGLDVVIDAGAACV